MTSLVFNWREHFEIHPAAELFPLMSEAELRELADDIKKNGLKAPIVIWEPDDPDNTDCYLLDGRNRLDAVALAGLLDGDRKLLDLKCDATLITGGDPYAAVLSFNVHRRHLTAELKRDLIAKVLKAKPDASNRKIAKQVKADDKTVASVRRDLESTAEIPQLVKTIGADGKARKLPAQAKANSHSVKTAELSPAAQEQIAKALEETTEASAEVSEQSFLVIDACLRKVQNAVTKALYSLPADDPNAVDVLFDKLGDCVLLALRANENRRRTNDSGEKAAA